MPEAGWPPVGTYGFKDLTKMQQENAAERRNQWQRLKFSLRNHLKKQPNRKILSSFFYFNQTIESKSSGFYCFYSVLK